MEQETLPDYAIPEGAVSQGSAQQQQATKPQEVLPEYAVQGGEPGIKPEDIFGRPGETPSMPVDGETPLSTGEMVASSFGSISGILNKVKTDWGYKDAVYDKVNGVVVQDKDGKWKKTGIMAAVGNQADAPFMYELYKGGIPATMATAGFLLGGGPVSPITSLALAGAAGAAGRAINKMIGAYVFGTNVEEDRNASFSDTLKMAVYEAEQEALGVAGGEVIGKGVQIGAKYASKFGVAVARAIKSLPEDAEEAITKYAFTSPEKAIERMKLRAADSRNLAAEASAAAREATEHAKHGADIEAEGVNRILDNELRITNSAIDALEAEKRLTTDQLEAKILSAKEVDLDRLAKIGEIKAAEKEALKSKLAGIKKESLEAASAGAADIEMKAAGIRKELEAGVDVQLKSLYEKQNSINNMKRSLQKEIGATVKKISGQYSDAEKLALAEAGKEDFVFDTSLPGMKMDPETLSTSEATESLRDYFIRSGKDTNVLPGGNSPVLHESIKLDSMLKHDRSLIQKAKTLIVGGVDTIPEELSYRAAYNELEQLSAVGGVKASTYKAVAEKNGLDAAKFKSDYFNGRVPIDFKDSKDLVPTMRNMIDLSRELRDRAAERTKSVYSATGGYTDRTKDGVARFMSELSKEIRSRIRGEVPQLETVARVYGAQKDIIARINKDIADKEFSTLANALENEESLAFFQSTVDSYREIAGPDTMKYFDEVKQYAAERFSLNSKMKRIGEAYKAIVKQQSDAMAEAEAHRRDIEISKASYETAMKLKSMRNEINDIKRNPTASQYKDELSQFLDNKAIDEQMLKESKAAIERKRNLMLSAIEKGRKASREAAATQLALAKAKIKDANALDKQVEAYQNVGARAIDTMISGRVRTAIMFGTLLSPKWAAVMAALAPVMNGGIIRRMVAAQAVDNIKRDFSSITYNTIRNKEALGELIRVTGMEYDILDHYGYAEALDSSIKNTFAMLNTINRNHSKMVLSAEAMQNTLIRNKMLVWDKLPKLGGGGAASNAIHDMAGVIRNTGMSASNNVLDGLAAELYDTAKAEGKQRAAEFVNNFYLMTNDLLQQKKRIEEKK